MANKFQDQIVKLQRESEERTAERRASELKKPYIDLRTAPFELEALTLVSREAAMHARVAPLERQGRKLQLAVFDSAAPEVSSILKTLESKHFIVSVYIASLSGLRAIWEKYALLPHEAVHITDVLTIDAARFASLGKELITVPAITAAITRFDFVTTPIEQLLDIILVGALTAHASDVHFEPEQSHVRLRYRVDGLLEDVATAIPLDNYHYMMSRIKLLGKLRLNVVAEPQDGRFTLALPEGRELEVRISVIPSEFGETVVLRLLYAEALQLSLPDLGLRADDLAIVTLELQKPDGMILNTGPTGSGKTTTLYVFLRHKQDPTLKIVTIEHPIEYHLPGIEQTQVDERAGYTFAAALKSILRQDPDIILVGEMNDEATAEVGVEAALTGHLVFSTVHANNAPAAIPRLLDLKVKPSSIGPAVNLIIAQRLLRRLCLVCRVPASPTPSRQIALKQFLTKLPARVVRPEPTAITVYSPGKDPGCVKCAGVGYKGRVGIFELFLLGDEEELAIISDSSEAHLKELARAQGMVSLQQDGILKVMAGLTSFEEVESTTGPLQF